MTGNNSSVLAGTKTILLDLDDTLLVNPMTVFIPAYISRFCEFVGDLVAPEIFKSSLLQGVQAMEKDLDPFLSNAEVFFSEFFSRVGVEESRLRPRLESFYSEEYPKLAELARPADFGREIVEKTFQAGWEVVIATNPLFPRSALEQRLDWADLPVTEFKFSLVTAFEDMHAAKPHPEYYWEILHCLGRDPGDCIMVGDDWERDMVPASSIGIRVFWIDGQETPPPGPIPSELWLGQGSLEELMHILWS